MKPMVKKGEPIEDMFRSRLENIINLRYPLAVLASRVDWARLERLWDEQVCERWERDPHI